jgi:hypothetical protein
LGWSWDGIEVRPDFEIGFRMGVGWVLGWSWSKDWVERMARTSGRRKPQRISSDITLPYQDWLRTRFPLANHAYWILVGHYAIHCTVSFVKPHFACPDEEYEK